MDVLSVIRAGLREQGFAHLPGLLISQRARSEFIGIARSLGRPITPPGCEPSWPVVETCPASDASTKRPFDRREQIGWHNDFTTHRWRPRWTLMWIVNPDPGGGLYGAWRVASTKDVVQDPIARGNPAWRNLRRGIFPFGYRFEQSVRYFKILYTSQGPGLRFNRRALIEGSLMSDGEKSRLTREIVQIIEGAADRNASTLPAGFGDLLAVDNWGCLHDRLELSVGNGSSTRRACLCFVNDPREHRRTTDPRGSAWD